jgi:hypothetical protein
VHSEKLGDLCCTPGDQIQNYTTGHVTPRGRRETHTGLWWGDVQEVDHVEDLGVGGKITLRWETGRGASSGPIWRRRRQVAGCSDHGNQNLVP